MAKIGIIIAVAILVILAKKMRQDVFSPAVVNILWNSFFVFGAVVAFGAGMQWKYEGIYWIFISCAMFLLGQTIAMRIQIPTFEKKIQVKNNYLGLILIVIVVLGIVQPLLYVWAFGYSVTDLLDINTLLKINTEIAYDRYYGHGYQATVLDSILSIVIYAGALIGGYSFHLMKHLLGKVLAMATLIPILFLAIITNAKVGVIASVFLWAIGWLIELLHEKKGKNIVSKKIITIGIVGAIAGIVFLDLTMVMRIGSISMETQMIVNQKLQEYAFGQVEAFSVWYDSVEEIDLEYGSNTFMFLTNWLGLTERKQGVYDLMPGIRSNIFTINRGVITDFGKVGGLFFWLLFGGFAGFVYKKVKSGDGNYIMAITLLAAVYFTILYGFIISPWIYSSYVLAFVAFAMFLYVLRHYNLCFKR